jgi:hypothetical protein
VIFVLIGFFVSLALPDVRYASEAPEVRTLE